MRRSDRPAEAGKHLGAFLRLAEFDTTSTYEEMYAKAGGKAERRMDFYEHVVGAGYIVVMSDGTVRLTGFGRYTARLLMK
jgi:hypothetical protein